MRPRTAPWAGTGTGLLLAAAALVLVATWPERPEVANASWYAVAVVRTSGLALWGALAGLAAPTAPAAARRLELAHLAVAAVATAPLEALAFAATAPDASLAWSLCVAVPTGVLAYGAGWALASVARRARLGWALPLLAPAAAVGVGYLDLRLGPPVVLPWLLPSSPSWIAAAVTVVASVLVVRAATRRADGRAAP